MTHLPLDGRREGIDYSYDMTSLADLAFQHDHPSNDRNVFLLMRFEPRPFRQRIHQLVLGAARELGLHLIRADDHDYSGELWTNVKLCLDNCSAAIAIFDGADECAENISVELGYLFARETPCLILRDVELGPPPAMLSHRLHLPFSKIDLEGTLESPVRRWLSSQARRIVA